MKGLLLKDWYMTVKYCKSYLLIVGVFMAVQALSPNYFYSFYAGIMAGLIPVTLISYDERSKWTVYSCALPYTRAQLVSAKYIVGGAAQLAAIAVMGTVQAVKLCAAGSFTLGGFAGFLALQLFVSSIICSINLPFVFKYGVEKGRISYYIIIIASFAVIGAIGFQACRPDLTTVFCRRCFWPWA